MWITFAFVWVFLSVVVAIYATGKDHSGTDFFIIALIISPLGAAILVVLLPPFEGLATMNRVKEKTGSEKLSNGQMKNFEPLVLSREADWQDAVRFIHSVKDAVEKVNDSVPLMQIDNAINELRSLYFQSGEEGITHSAVNMIINEAKYRELETQQQASVWK
ncbi:hypothetical protein [Photobacterium sp. DNB22_13_2]